MFQVFVALIMAVCLLSSPARAANPLPVQMWSEPAPSICAPLPCALWCEPDAMVKASPEAMPLPLFGEPQPVKPRLKSAGYPVRAKETWWTGCPMDKDGALLHLSTGAHATDFDPVWLATLTLEQLQSLHSDHHEQRVAWGYVQRPVQAPAKKPLATAPTLQWQTLQNCPTGFCPKRG